VKQRLTYCEFVSKALGLRDIFEELLLNIEECHDASDGDERAELANMIRDDIRNLQSSAALLLENVDTPEEIDIPKDLCGNCCACSHETGADELDNG
jgi:hypothetical protein